MASCGKGLEYQNVPNTEGTLSYVDFLPDILVPATLIKAAELANFSTLVHRANKWLASNPGYRVKTCESVELVSDSNGQANTNKSQYEELGENRFMRCLRLWYTVTTSQEPQEIGYMTIVPICTDEGGVFSQPHYEDFAETLNRLNEMFRRNQLPGKILNVETQEMKLKESMPTADPEKTLWCERLYNYLIVIRVFYEVGSPICEQLGYTDFVPEFPSTTSEYESNMFEPMNSMVERARNWISSQPGLHVISLQSINYKMHLTENGQLDTLRSRYSGHDSVRYVRILRVFYRSEHSQTLPRDPLRWLSCKTFVPLQLTTDMFTFEGVSETMDRARAWLAVTGAKVVAAETIKLKQKRYLTKCYSPDPERTSFQFYVGIHWVIALRLYLDGRYQDLPEAPPARPEPQNVCCTLF